MLKTNAAIVALKGLTFVPIAALIYFSDYTVWFNYLISNRIEGFFIGGLALLGAGAWLKREMIETYVQTSVNSISSGSIALAASVACYFIGTFYFFEPLFHFWSLLLLVVAYLFFRTDARLVRLTAPLFLIVGIAFSSSLIIGGVSLIAILAPRFPASLAGSLLVGAIILGIFISYTNPWYASRKIKILVSNSVPRTWIVPFLITALVVVFWTFPFWPLLAAIPLPIALFIPKRLQRRLSYPVPKLLFRCMRHTASGEGDGFCDICGTRFEEYGRTPRAGLLGLAIVILIVGALIFASVPLLYYDGVTPYSGIYSFSGAAKVQLPISSPGWLVNSSSMISNPQDVYALKQVYVPATLPETKNYTLYYELSSSAPLIATTSWGILPGWNRSSVAYSLEGLAGSLITYLSNRSIMMVYVGTGRLNFIENGGSFQRLAMGVSVVGNFSKADANVSSTQFTNDLNSAIGPMLSNQEYNSGWTDFFQRISQGLSLLESLLLIVFSSLGIGLGVYFIQSHDSKVSSLFTQTSELTDKEWEIVSAILRSNPIKGTTSEIAGFAHAQSDLQGLIEFSRKLQGLEQSAVIKKTYSERMGQLLLTWKESI